MANKYSMKGFGLEKQTAKYHNTGSTITASILQQRAVSRDHLPYILATVGDQI